MPNSSHSIYQQVTQLRLNKPIKQSKETNTIFELGSDHKLELKALKSKNVKLLLASVLNYAQVWAHLKVVEVGSCKKLDWASIRKLPAKRLYKPDITMPIHISQEDAKIVAGLSVALFTDRVRCEND